MKNIFNPEIFLPHREEHEFPKGRRGLVFCKICNAVYYKKSWHKNLSSYKNLKEDLAVKFSVCPACAMIAHKQFEGEITINNIPAGLMDNLIHLVEAFGHRASARDSQHRLIKIERQKNNLRLTFTDNQPAIQLAKKIKTTFKKAKVKISYSPTPGDTAYVRIEF